ncbi:unnamed protein product, partial [Heterosigma akashiwo]
SYHYQVVYLGGFFMGPLLVSRRLSGSVLPKFKLNAKRAKFQPTIRWRSCIVYNVESGLQDYQRCWQIQKALFNKAIDNQKQGIPGSDSLLLVEHPSVYTLGRGSSLENLKFNHEDRDCPHKVFRIERGGEVTWHGPGQLVGYPILDLNFHKKDLKGYLYNIEEMIIKVLACRGVLGGRDPENTGVWVGDYKFCAIGVKASRWITMHGFALNVNPNLSYFDEIIPCGIHDKGVGSLQQVQPGVSMKEVRRDVI